MKKVPVTILSGQLGSGKSTLLRRILTQQNQFKIAIIMNEFAQTASIEGKSIQLTVANEGTQVQEWLELDNGCLCCSAQDQGVLAIESLMQRQGTFDYIIIETTGIADPSQIALLFWLDSALESLLYLDGIVTVVDCLNFQKQLEDEEFSNSGTVTKQIAVADSLYLSKIDLTSESKLVSLKQSIRRINDSNLVNQSDEDLEAVLKKLLNLDAFSIYRQVPKSFIASTYQEKLVEMDSELKSRLTREVGNSLGKNFKTSHDSFSTITIKLPILKQVDSSDCKFDQTFRNLIWEGILGGNQSKEKSNSDTDLAINNSHHVGDEPMILRAKGLLKDLDGNWFVLQAVRDMYEVQRLDPNIPMDSLEQPRLVLIGKNLDDDLGKQFLKEIS